MMNLFRFATAMVLLAGWGLAALSLHVVRTANGVQLIPKNELSPTDTYVDVRHWSNDDAEKHPVLVARLQQLDKTNLLEAVADAPVEDDAPKVAAAPEKKAEQSSPTDLSRAWARANAIYGRGR